jgi:hypothetical protein
VLFYPHAMVTGDPAKLAAERTAVRDILRAMPPFPALEGPISFGKNGDALKPVYIIEMQDGYGTCSRRIPRAREIGEGRIDATTLSMIVVSPHIAREARLGCE